MHVAEIVITTGNFGGTSTHHSVAFDDAEKASAEFDRLAAIIKTKNERGNDYESTIEVVGSGARFTCPVGNIVAVGISDWAKANEQQDGVRDKFPNLFKR